MSKNEKDNAAPKPIYIVIAVAAAVFVVAVAVMPGLQRRPTQAESSGEAVGIKIPGYPSISLPANQQDVELALVNGDTPKPVALQFNKPETTSYSGTYNGTVIFTVSVKAP